MPSAASEAEFNIEQKTTQWPGWQAGSPTCSGSGTRADEFGAEASRTLWRVALDALWFDDSRAIQLSQHVSMHAVLKLLRNLDLEPACDIKTVQASWQKEVR